MALLHSKCGNCHSIIGTPKNMFNIDGLNLSETCKTESRTRQKDEGAAVYQISETRETRRCPECGRTQQADWKIQKKTLKHWKDNKCETSENNVQAGKALENELENLRENNVITGEEKQKLRHKIEEVLYNDN